ncbi:MAG: hypothetical protein JO013_00635 [Alphaproteobacteria bacterium]|nr:hypothetical protein [Alphaproteobacteria bacterium]
MEDLPTPCASMIANELSSVRIGLKRLDNAKVIWVNERAGAFDREYRGSFADEDTYRAHLLDACAFVIARSEPADGYGWADRYGGAGIGRHGGSGRSAIVNGYSVKGIGPTPLLGVGEGLAHSSGGAYLEEAIREILFSQLLQRILPHGALPILAIIDTGVDQAWHLEDAIKLERRVLIVRPFSLRLAHFERAYRYCPGNYQGKRDDMRRVRHNLAIFSDRYGVDWLKRKLATGYLNWAEQIAYASIHNLALGTSPSNLALDGGILDFGAVSTLPVRANYVTSPGNTVLAEFTKLTDSLAELALPAKDFDHSAFRDFDSDLESRIVDTYERRLLRELLSRIGLGACYEQVADDARAREEIIRGFLAHHRQAMRLRVDLIAPHYNVTHPALPSLESIWSDDRAASLQMLASTLERYFPKAEFDPTQPVTDLWSGTRESLRQEVTNYLASCGPLVDLAEAISYFGTRWA